jgi:hypothetical protein
MRAKIVIGLIALCIGFFASAGAYAVDESPDDVIRRIVKQQFERRGSALTDNTIAKLWNAVSASPSAESWFRPDMVLWGPKFLLEMWRSAKLSREQGRVAMTADYLSAKAAIEGAPAVAPADLALVRNADALIQAAATGDEVPAAFGSGLIDDEAIEVTISQAEAMVYRLDTLLHQRYGMPERAWLLEPIRAQIFSQFPFVLSFDKHTLFDPEGQRGMVRIYTYYFDDDIIESISSFEARRKFSADELSTIATLQYREHNVPFHASNEEFRGKQSVLVAGGPSAPGDKDGLVTRFIQDPVRLRVTVLTSHSRLGEAEALAHQAAFEKRLTLY